MRGYLIFCYLSMFCVQVVLASRGMLVTVPVVIVLGLGWAVLQLIFFLGGLL